MDALQHIYLIRHGKTDHNGRRIFQSDNAPLNKVGIKQAERTAQILERHIRLVISSPLLRAQQTAQIVASHFECPLEIDPIVTEIRNPPMIRGRSYDDPNIEAIYTQWCAELLDPGACSMEGAENYHDLLARARQLLGKLSERQERTVAIVTHSEFIRAVLACIVLESEASPEAFNHFKSHTKIHNGTAMRLSLSKGGATKYRLVF